MYSVNQNIDINKKIKTQQFNVNIGLFDFAGLSNDTLRSNNWKPKRQAFGQIMWVSKIRKNNLRFRSYYFDEKLVELGNENFPPFDGTALDNHYLTIRNTNDLIRICKAMIPLVENYWMQFFIKIVIFRYCGCITR